MRRQQPLAGGSAWRREAAAAAPSSGDGLPPEQTHQQLSCRSPLPALLATNCNTVTWLGEKGAGQLMEGWWWAAAGAAAGKAAQRGAGASGKVMGGKEVKKGPDQGDGSLEVMGGKRCAAAGEGGRLAGRQESGLALLQRAARY